MDGYAEHFDFENGTISGWVFDADAADNREVKVSAYLDGDVIGTAGPSGSRADLAKVSNQDLAFSLQCSRPFTALCVESGRLSVKAASPLQSGRFKIRAARMGASTPLKMTSNGRRRIRREALSQMLAQDPEYRESLRRSVWTPDELEQVQPNVDAGKMSTQLLPVGLYSDDKSSMLGEHGQIFLVGGSNRVLEQYQTDFDFGPEGAEGKVAEWLDIFAARRQESESRGIRYFQTVIPEKLTALRKYSPVPIDGPIPIYGMLEKALKDDPWYVSGMEPFEPWKEEDDPYVTTGSHFSASGAKELFAALVHHIDPSVEDAVWSIVMDEVRYEIEDLSERFYGLPLHSQKIEPSTKQFDKWTGGLTLTHRNIPTGHIGRRFSWANPTAPSPLKVLVYGNSFFGHGENPGQLAWWGKQFFAEFHHVWGPDFNWSIADEVKPDVVVGQTIERFLRLVAKK